MVNPDENLNLNLTDLTPNENLNNINLTDLNPNIPATNNPDIIYIEEIITSDNEEKAETKKEKVEADKLLVDEEDDKESVDITVSDITDEESEDE